MTSILPDLSRVTLDEIIFEGRNQAYGAFELRRIYDRHLRRAVALTVLLCLGIVATPLVLRQLEGGAAAPVVQPPVVADWHETTDVPPLEPVPAKPQRVEKPPVVNTKEFVTRRIVRDEELVNEAPVTAMVDLNAGSVGTKTVTDGVDGPEAPSIPVPVGDGAGTAPAPDVVESWVEEMPAFPGGMEALVRYISTHVKYPPLALRNGIEGKVFIKFVVDETGRVQNPVVLKGIGGGCDEEAVRVIESLPAFAPGRQNGRAVKVYFNVPISFTIR